MIFDWPSSCQSTTTHCVNYGMGGKEKKSYMWLTKFYIGDKFRVEPSNSYVENNKFYIKVTKKRLGTKAHVRSNFYVGGTTS